MPTRILSSLIFLHIWSLALGQMNSNCSVFVLDARTREPVVAATVQVEGVKGGVFTDTLGQFHLSSKHFHTSVTIRSIGYNAWSGTFGADSGTQTVLLEPAENVLGTVVVSGTLKEVSKDASPIPVEIFTPRYFQKNASPTIFEALTMVNGVRPQLNCNVCNTGDIHINGLEGPYTMVTLDGMPIVSGLSTVYGLSGIPNGMVERIEVVKGPAGTLYGSEAVGGLINIITKNALTAPRLFADVFGMSNGEFNADLAGAVRFGKTHTLLGVNYFNFQNRLDINQDNFTDIALQERVSVFNKWNLEQKNNRSASLAWRYVHEDRWGGELQWEPRWRGTDSVYGESIRTDRIEVLAKYELPLKSRRIALDLSWNLHNQNSAYGNTPFLGRQEVAFGQISTDLPLGAGHDALLGAALRYTDYDDNTPATTAPDGMQNLPARTWLPGIFVQDEIQVGRRNRLLLGLRYDHHSAHGHILTPRISWKWAKDAQHILRLTAGSGYRVANIFTEDHAALSGAREVVIAEGLLPERTWNANLNYVRKFFPKHTGFIGLDASLFFTYFSNQIVPDYDTDPNKIVYANLDGYGISQGVSLNLDFNFLNGLKIIAGATAMEVYRVENDRRLPQYFAPPLSATWTITYPIPGWNLTLDYTGNLNSPMHLPVQPNDPRPPQSPWFSVHNVQATFQVPATWKVLRGFEFYLGIKNLLGFFPREEVILRAFDPFDKNVQVDNPLGLTFDPTYNYAPVQRQRVLVGVRWTVGSGR
ncbi:MAG: TonB-dependent receptor [Saprospiraceae bacterium]|nr:TonB-dependent receptor [Saprospiraceae bacterium]